MKRYNKSEKLISIAANLISRKGYDGVSLQEIANKVGIHKSTLFHYIKSKADLFSQVFGKSIYDANDKLERLCVDGSLQPEQKLKKAIENHLTDMIRYFDYTNIFLYQLRSLSAKDREMALIERRKYEKNFEKIIAGMKTKGHFKRLDTQITTFGLLGMLNWVPRWFRSDGRMSIKEISSMFYKLIVEKR